MNALPLLTAALLVLVASFDPRTLGSGRVSSRTNAAATGASPVAMVTRS